MGFIEEHNSHGRIGNSFNDAAMTFSASMTIFTDFSSFAVTFSDLREKIVNGGLKKVNNGLRRVICEPKNMAPSNVVLRLVRVNIQTTIS